MTRGRGNTGIFRQIWHFSKVLVIWRAGVGVWQFVELNAKQVVI
jgi:hypothetical protein